MADANDKKLRPLTQNQETFALKYIETGSASEAYRFAYDTNATANTVQRSAYETLHKPNVAARVQELRNEVMKCHKITVDSLVHELEEARQAALGAATPQASAAVNATMGKAKLTGLDKIVVDHISSDGSMPMPTIIQLLPVESTEDEQDD